MERLIRSLDRVLHMKSKFGVEAEAAKSGMRPVVKWAAVGAGVCAAVAAGAAGNWLFQNQVRAPVALVSDQKASGAQLSAASSPASTATAAHTNAPVRARRGRHRPRSRRNRRRAR